MKEYIVRCEPDKITFDREIVRCKECRNRYTQKRCAGRHPDWFCADGVKQVTGKLESVEKATSEDEESTMGQPKSKLDTDIISRQAAIEAMRKMYDADVGELIAEVESLPPVEPERKWTPCSNPPKHHGDVLVRGIEAIGNVKVHKVMQWDVDRWRPMDYSSSVTWEEWSEI